MKNFLIILLCWVANVEALELKMSKPRNIIVEGDFQSKQEDHPSYTIRTLSQITTPEFIIIEGVDDNLQTINKLNNKPKKQTNFLCKGSSKHCRQYK